MTLREMIGQRLVTGFEGPEMTDVFKEAVRKYKIGNVILFTRNIQSAMQLKKLCADIQEFVTAETGYPAFITIDQEGGTVSRLPSDCTVIPGAMAMATTGNAQYVYEAGLLTGRELNTLGVNFDLAPVLDVNSNPHNPVIGVRSYGDQPEKVAEYGIAMMKGLTDGGVLSCGKHFPGHGDTDVDSHIGLPVIDKSLEVLEQCELIPFRRAIDAGIPAIMTTHIIFPQIDPEYPATMSRTIMTGILRERFGYQGLIISDCMMMKAIADHYGTVNGVMKAMQAGVDLVFVCHDPMMAGEALELVEQKIANVEMSMFEMEQSVNRILEAKKLMRPSSGDDQIPGCAEHREKVRIFAEHAVTLVSNHLENLGERPIFFGCQNAAQSVASDKVKNTQSFAAFMQEKLGGDSCVTSLNPTDDEIKSAKESAAGHTAIVVGLLNGLKNKWQIRLVNELNMLGIPVIAVTLHIPYDLMELSDTVCKLAAYGYDMNTLDAVANVLDGSLKPTGQLPVKLN